MDGNEKNQDLEIEKLKLSVPSGLAETLARFEVKLDLAIKEVESIKDTINSDFVTKAEFWPVRALVYGFAALVFTSVIGALLGLVIMRK